MGASIHTKRCDTVVHDVFPGIQLCYIGAHTSGSHAGAPPSPDVLEIHHCREGRMECRLGDKLCYMASGDLLIARAATLGRARQFPLQHYHGAVVRMDMRRTPRCLSCFLQDVTVQPEALAQRLCGQDGCFIARSDPAVAHLFAELYAVPPVIQKGYYKVKILELLLFLSVLDTGQDEFSRHALPSSQAELANKVSRYLMAHRDERIPLETLSARFAVSGTLIKNAFRAVYGIPLYAYIRAQKMESAAYMLEHTDKPVLQIAGEHGYDNGSKFANAFRQVKGMTPSAYRAAHQ